MGNGKQKSKPFIIGAHDSLEKVAAGMRNRFDCDAESGVRQMQGRQDSSPMFEARIFG